MWTLFDPLVRPVQSESTHETMPKDRTNSTQAQAPTTSERLWSLLEPTGPLTRRFAIILKKV